MPIAAGFSVSVHRLLGDLEQAQDKYKASMAASSLCSNEFVASLI